MTAIDGDLDQTTISQQPSTITLKATTTTAILAGGTVTFTADKDVWTTTPTTTCTGSEITSMSSINIGTALTSVTTPTSIVITLAAAEAIAAGVTLVFQCTGDLMVNSATLNEKTMFTAVSSTDVQNVAFGAGYETSTAHQGALAITSTQFTIAKPKPESIVFTWTPKNTATVAPTTITLTHTIATPWNANGAVTCVKSGTNMATLTSAIVSNSGGGLNANDKITFTVASASGGTNQHAIVITCSTASDFAVQPPAVTVISTTGVSDTDVTVSSAATYSTVARSLSWTSAALTGTNPLVAGNTPTGIVFVIGVTDALANTNTITITASSSIFTGAAPTCGTGTTNEISATAATTTELTLTVGSATIAAGTSTVTCTGGMAVTATTRTIVTFTAVSATSTIAITAQPGFTTSSRLTWTTAPTLTGSYFAGATASAITFTIGITDALVAGDTITLTASTAIWTKASGEDTSCGINAAPTAISGSATILSSGVDVLTMTVGAGGIGVGSSVIICTGGLAANPATATTATFSAVSTKSTTEITAQTGYLTTSSLSWTSAALTGTNPLFAGNTPTGIVFVIGVTDALANTNTITITASSSIFTGATAVPTCGTGTTNEISATAATTTELTLTVGSATIAAGSAKTVTCTGGMAPSAAMSTTVTFSAVSTMSTVTITAQTGFLTTSSIGWTSVTVGGSSAANIAPTSLAFAVTVTNTLAQGQTLTITASSAVWSTTQPSSCTTGVANAVGAFVTTPTSLVVTAGTATLASGATTITCVGGLALNPSVATTVTFGAVSEVSTIPITGQTGYTTTEVAPGTFVSVEPFHRLRGFTRTDVREVHSSVQPPRSLPAIRSRLHRTRRFSRLATWQRRALASRTMARKTSSFTRARRRRQRVATR